MKILLNVSSLIIDYYQLLIIMKDKWQRSCQNYILEGNGSSSFAN